MPFASSYKPAAVALGVVAMYLLLAIELTSLAMRKLPRRTWHAVHLTSFVAVRRRDGARHSPPAPTGTTRCSSGRACSPPAVVLMMTLVRIWSPRRAARAEARVEAD